MRSRNEYTAWGSPSQGWHWQSAALDEFLQGGIFLRALALCENVLTGPFVSQGVCLHGNSGHWYCHPSTDSRVHVGREV